MDQTGLVERASQGDHEAFGVLIGAHLARLDTAARLILRDPELARDAVQEATLKASRNLRGLRDPDRFDAYVRDSQRRICLQGDLVHRRRSERRRVDVDVDQPTLPPGERPKLVPHPGRETAADGEDDVGLGQRL